MSEINQVEYVRTESSNDLTDWQMGHSLMVKPVLGVGGGSVGTKLKARYKMVEVANDLYCVMPVEVYATFYANPQIHIASNFARGSCEYSEVLAHEQKHITVLRKFFREERDGYGDYFYDLMRSLPVPEPVPLTKVESGKKAITASIMKDLDDYSQKLMDELNDRQRKIDTKKEYERVISKCDNWEKKLIGKKR